MARAMVRRCRRLPTCSSLVAFGCRLRSRRAPRPSSGRAGPAFSERLGSRRNQGREPPLEVFEAPAWNSNVKREKHAESNYARDGWASRMSRGAREYLGEKRTEFAFTVGWSLRRDSI